MNSGPRVCRRSCLSNRTVTGYKPVTVSVQVCARKSRGRHTLANKLTWAALTPELEQEYKVLQQEFDIPDGTEMDTATFKKTGEMSLNAMVAWRSDDDCKLCLFGIDEACGTPDEAKRKLLRSVRQQPCSDWPIAMVLLLGDRIHCWRGNAVEVELLASILEKQGEEK